jgi:hypothetical protein
MIEIDPELDRRLGLLREVAEPTSSDKHRLLDALRASMHTRADTPPGSVPPERRVGVARARRPWATVARPLWPWLGGVCIGASLTLALGAGWERVRAKADAKPIAPGRIPTLAAGGASADTLSAVRVPERLGVVHAPPPGRAEREPSVPPPPPAQPDLAEALEQLHRAERALHAGNAELALGILSDLDRRTEPGLLLEERLTTRVLALCQEARLDEALDARRQLEREFVSSIYTRRLDQSCAVESERR